MALMVAHPEPTTAMAFVMLTGLKRWVLMGINQPSNLETRLWLLRMPLPSQIGKYAVETVVFGCLQEVEMFQELQ